MSTKLELYFELGHIILDPEYHTEYTLKKLLGRGAYAQCYLATVENNEKFALKVVKLADIKSNKVREKLETEIQIHSVLDHPNIVKMYRTFRTSEYVFMVLELCERGALDTLLKRNGKLKERYVSKFIQQIVIGMMYLHNHMNVVHRDLKLGNLFLDAQLNIKIGDFGLSAVIKQGEKKVTMCGTPNYIAPEVLFGKANGHSFEADVWSLGVIIYTLLIGVPPFQTKSVEEIYKKIKDNNYMIPDNLGLSSDAIDLITQVLITNPVERPTLEQILNHKFITRKEHFLLRIYKNLMTLRYTETELECDYALFSIPVSKLRGIGYILRSGVYGLYFNDGTSIILRPNRMSIIYFTKDVQNGRSVYFKEEHLIDKVPQEIMDPYNKLLYFIRTFDLDYKFCEVESAFIAKVKKIGSGFLYVLSNNVVMFDFVDGSKVVASDSGSKIFAFDNLGRKVLGNELKEKCVNILKLCMGNR